MIENHALDTTKWTSHVTTFTVFESNEHWIPSKKKSARSTDSRPKRNDEILSSLFTEIFGQGKRQQARGISRCWKARRGAVNQRRCWSLLGVGRTEEHRCQSSCELRPRSSAPASGTLPSLAGATVRVHASTRGNRAFNPMDRAKRENDTHSKPTLYGNKRLLGNESSKRDRERRKKLKKTNLWHTHARAHTRTYTRAVILVAIDLCWSWLFEWILFDCVGGGGGWTVTIQVQCDFHLIVRLRAIMLIIILRWWWLLWWFCDKNTGGRFCAFFRLSLTVGRFFFFFFFSF